MTNYVTARQPSVYASLKLAVLNERDQVDRQRREYWHDGVDTATPNDVARIANRRTLLVEIAALVAKFEAAERNIQ